jgi:hypothetical protein
MNNAGEEGIYEGFHLAKSDRAVPGGVGAEGHAPHLRRSFSIAQTVRAVQRFNVPKRRLRFFTRGSLVGRSF